MLPGLAPPEGAEKGAGATTHLCPLPSPSQCLVPSGHPGVLSWNADVAPLPCGASQWPTTRVAHPRDLFLLPEDTFHVPGLPYNKLPRLFLSVPVRCNTAGSGASPRRILERPGSELSAGRSFRDGTRTPAVSQTRALLHNSHAYCFVSFF